MDSSDDARAKIEDNVPQASAETATTPKPSSDEIAAGAKVQNDIPATAPIATPLDVPTHNLSAPPVEATEEITEEKGEVSSLYVGRVIGKGGEMIRDLQAYPLV